jgi:hypothetical protein
VAQKGREPHEGDDVHMHAEDRRQDNRQKPLRRIEDKRDNPQLLAGGAHDIRGPDVPTTRLPGIDPFELPQDDPNGNGPQKVSENHQERV